MEFWCCRNILFLLEDENGHRITYFICVHYWEVLFPKIQKKSKEVDLRVALDVFLAAHSLKALCMAPPVVGISVEPPLSPFLVFFLAFFCLFHFCLSFSFYAYWNNTKETPEPAPIISCFVPLTDCLYLLKTPLCLSVTLLLVQRTMVSYKLS